MKYRFTEGEARNLPTSSLSELNPLGYIPRGLPRLHIINGLIPRPLAAGKFIDGRVIKVNLESYAKRGGIFSSLEDTEYFRKFFIDLNTLCWPNGADIAPETLYEIGNVIVENSKAPVSY